MTREKSKFIQLKKCKGGSVSLGNNTTVNICGKGILSLDGKNPIKNDLYVEGLKHNLLSVIQMCENGYKVTFDLDGWKIRKNEKIVAQGVKIDSNLYNLCEVKGQSYPIGQADESWLWHRRLGHANFDNLVKVSSKGLVRHFPKITKPTNIICKEFQQGKQTRVVFQSKEYSTTKPLQLVHTDLCGPTRTRGLKGERYFIFLIDDSTRMTWVTFLKDKSQAFERFKIFRKMVEKETGRGIKCLRSDRGEFT